MKNFLSFTIACTLLAVSLGCNWVSGLEDEAVNVAVGDSKVGIKECDDVIEQLTESLNNPDDGVIVKGAKRMALNQFREELKRRVDQSGADQRAVADFCREFRNNLSDPAPANSNSAASNKR